MIKDALALGSRLAAMLDAAAEASEPGPGVTRLPFTPEHRAVLDRVAGWMRAAGLEPALDAAGTLHGRTGGEGPGLLIGSHLDSVRHGGRFDGILGVAAPLLALAALHEAGRRPARPVEVLAFADEEGVRFPTALMGPRALAGTFDATALRLADRDATTLGDAMRAFGLDPDALPRLRRDPAGIAGYVELHIEQGPLLQHLGVPLGVVTAICGIERHAVRLTGRAAHAGTTPMHLRADALAGAAELVLAAEARARDTDGLMATVGALDVTPNVVNAVPGAVALSLEIRAPDDALREAAGRALTERAQAIAAGRGLDLAMERTYVQRAQPCDPELAGRLARAAGGDVPRLASGATHDASAMADLCPVAMLFVRCRDGTSHHPDEHVDQGDLDAAVRALIRLLEMA